MMGKIIFINEENQKVTLEAMKEEAGSSLSGLSPKNMGIDPKEGAKYIIKGPKQRSILTLFGKEYINKLLEDYAAEIIRDSGVNIPNLDKALSEAMREAFETFFSRPIIELTPENLRAEFEKKRAGIISDLLKMIDTHVDSSAERQKIAQNIQNVINKAENQIDRLTKHVSDTLCNFIHTEMLGPQVAKALWGDAVVVPNTFYIQDSDALDPGLVSRFLVSERNTEESKFNEFLQPIITAFAAAQLKTKEPLVIKSPSFWGKDMPRPKLADLALEPQQKRIMGNLYAMALITGHYDIFNNIDGTNSGSIDGKPVCVDWGNSFNIGFGGLTKDENFIDWNKNNAVMEDLLNMSAEAFQEKYAGMNAGLSNNDYTFPFMAQIFPFIPRMLVSDLFDLADPDIYEGFMQFVDIAANNVDKVPEAYEKAWPKNPKINGNLNKDWYAPDGESCSIVQARVAQLKRASEQLKQVPPARRNAALQTFLVQEAQTLAKQQVFHAQKASL